MSEKHCEKCVNINHMGHCRHYGDCYVISTGALMAGLCKHYELKPEPSEFEKAWKQCKEGGELLEHCSEGFRAGWQARGKADAKASDAQTAPMSMRVATNLYEAIRKLDAKEKP